MCNGASHTHAPVDRLDKPGVCLCWRRRLRQACQVCRQVRGDADCAAVGAVCVASTSTHTHATNRQTGRQADRQTGRQAQRRTNRPRAVARRHERTHWHVAARQRAPGSWRRARSGGGGARHGDCAAGQPRCGAQGQARHASHQARVAWRGRCRETEAGVEKDREAGL